MYGRRTLLHKQMLPSQFLSKRRPGLSGNFSHSQCPLSCVYQKVVQMSISTVPRHRKYLFKRTFHVQYDLTRKVCIVHK